MNAAILRTRTVVNHDRGTGFSGLAIRSLMNLSLSIDHRVLDGLAAARFLQQVKRWLEAVDESLPLF